MIDGYLTVTSDQAAQTTRMLDARRVVVVHTQGWDHFNEGPDTVAEAFSRAGLGDRLVLLAPGGTAHL